MSAAHTPGRVCDACEGFCLQTESRVDAGAEISLRIGQHVRHRDHDGKRVTGRVRGLSIDYERTLQVDIVLDAPIVLPALVAGDREVSIWRQHVPAHELTAFDGRDEVIDGLLQALRYIVDAHHPDAPDHMPELRGIAEGAFDDLIVAKALAAIAKATDVIPFDGEATARPDGGAS